MTISQFCQKLWAHFRGLPKTIYFNFHYLPLSQAIKLPIMLSHKVRLMECSGKIILPKKVHIRMIQIGFEGVGIFDAKYSRSIWQVSGTVIFNGTAAIGHGSKISVGKDAVLTIGNHFCITAESSIVCQKEITFGDDVLISWENLFIDTDFHHVKQNGNAINPPEKIIIGNHVWIGCRCTILKGSTIPSNSILGARSLVNKAVGNTERAIIAGSPAKVLKSDVDWSK